MMNSASRSYWMRRFHGLPYAVLKDIQLTVRGAYDWVTRPEVTFSEQESQRAIAELSWYMKENGRGNYEDEPALDRPTRQKPRRFSKRNRLY